MTDETSQKQIPGSATGGGSSTTPTDPTPVPGQPSFEVVSGSTTQFEITLQNDSSTHITLGSDSAPNEIFFNGGIKYHVTTLSNTGTSYTVSDNDFLLVVTSATYTNCIIPAAAGRNGKTFIIIRRFGGLTPFTITASGGDTFDGEPTFNLPDDGMRIQIISDGISDWNTL